MTRFGWEPLKTLLAEPNFRDIAQAYYDELWGDTGVVCVPDWDKRQAMEDAFCYRIWTAHVDGTLAGFIEFQLGPTVNARDTLFAVDLGHFISPTFRGKGVLGYRMWRAAERALEEMGVRAMLCHDNMKHPLMPFFLSLGMKPIGTLFHKVIGQ